jgi:hypothetical protein
VAEQTLSEIMTTIMQRRKPSKMRGWWGSRKNLKALMKAMATTCLKTWSSKFFRQNLFCRDYEPKPELDKYESEGLDDDGDNQELDYNARREIERKMD